MAKAKDRSPAAVALAFVERIDPGARHVRVADVAALVRAVRRECAGVAREPYRDAVGALAGDEPAHVGALIADAILALNRAPRRGR